MATTSPRDVTHNQLSHCAWQCGLCDFALDPRLEGAAACITRKLQWRRQQCLRLSCSHAKASPVQAGRGERGSALTRATPVCGEMFLL